MGDGGDYAAALVAAAKNQHRATPNGRYCRACRETWLCLTIRVANELERVTAHIGGYQVDPNE